MDRRGIRNLFLTSIAQAVGKNGTPLCGYSVKDARPGPPELKTLIRFFSMIPDFPGPAIDNTLMSALVSEYREAETIFIDYYEKHPDLAEAAEKALAQATTDEERARGVAELWLPELTIPDEEILPKWKLSGVRENPDPVKPDEVTIQLNALYTVPEREPPADLPAGVREAWHLVNHNPGGKMADYDHPVPLFESEDRHELLKCLEELNRDIEFEKSMGVLPYNHKVIVTLSVSVTHRNLDHPCNEWLRFLLDQKHYAHLSMFVLTEESVDTLKKSIPGLDLQVFSVLGKYGRHFNALKYVQLILEQTHGIRAGFKLDTDEGIHSEDLHKATGKTWFQTMCHPLWGGTARDWKGDTVTLDVNVGEYINSTDIQRLGYGNALREPDVKEPHSYGGPSIFFHKGFAHGRATRLYNTFRSLDDHISHPVVKGGGYGITNDGLKKAYPFAFSEVGRAEDQQFYFSGLPKGTRGIFHPLLRIVHYKSSVVQSEDKTMTTRFTGDLYRLIIFQHLVDMLGVKGEIDPMPGAFAGPLARCQAFFHMVLTAFTSFCEGKTEEGRTILLEGLKELGELKKEIDSGKIKRRWDREQQEWEAFGAALSSIDQNKIKEIIQTMLV